MDNNNNMYSFTIVDSESQRTKEIKSNATNIAELKRDLRQNGFNVEDKTIQEALTRTEFKDDSSLLPHDVSYKGSITNNLVFRLTKTNKQVKSGMDRKEVYAKIKELNLGEAIKAEFGKNFTQCSTNDLINFISSRIFSKKPAKVETMKAEAPEANETFTEKKETIKECSCMTIIWKLIDRLVANDCIDDYDVEEILGSATEEDNNFISDTPTYSKDELSNLLEDL